MAFLIVNPGFSLCSNPGLKLVNASGVKLKLIRGETRFRCEGGGRRELWTV
jgi:hypothetical protein